MPVCVLDGSPPPTINTHPQPRSSEARVGRTGRRGCSALRHHLSSRRAVSTTESADISEIDTNGSVRSASITGSSPASWSLIANNQLDPVGIAVTTQGIFWINAGIGGANPDGSLVWQPNGNTPAVPIGSPYACPLAMTVTDTNIYWVNCDQSTGDHNEPLLTVPLGNPTATPTVLVPNGIACIQAIASGSNSLYWIQSGCFSLFRAGECPCARSRRLGPP